MKSGNFFFRLEWLSLVYLSLFVLAVLSPSIVTHGLFGIKEAHVEEIFIFTFGIVGLATFSITQRYMERKEKEHEEAKNEYDRAKRELVDSYRYIGSVNRQIEVLKRLVNETSQQIMEGERLTKDLLMSLMANAASSVGASTAFIRCVELEKLRTDYELLHSVEGVTQLKVSNKNLLRVHESGAAYAYIQSDDGRELIVVPSDHRDVAIKTYLLVATEPARASELDTSLLKVFANQAALLYHTLTKTKRSPNALELVGEAQKQVVGEIS